MERLTVQKFGELFMKYSEREYRSPCFGCESINRCNPEKKACSSYEALKKLAEYEDLEEQGKLLKLPCAVGDTVYVIEVDEENFTHFYCPRKISEYKFNLQMVDLLEMFGKCIFLTREEAEAALKETRE